MVMMFFDIDSMACFHSSGNLIQKMWCCNSLLMVSHTGVYLMIAQVEYSLLRQGDSNWLLHRVLDDIVDHLLPISRAHRMRLRVFNEVLQQQKASFRQEYVKQVLMIKADLQRLQRRVRPMVSCVRHLVDDPQLETDVKVTPFSYSSPARIITTASCEHSFRQPPPVAITTVI